MIPHKVHCSTPALVKSQYDLTATKPNESRQISSNAHRPRSFKQIDLTRGIRAARNAGCEPTSAEVRPDGTIHLSFQPQSERSELAFDEWKAKNADPS